MATIISFLKLYNFPKKDIFLNLKWYNSCKIISFWKIISLWSKNDVISENYITIIYFCKKYIISILQLQHNDIILENDIILILELDYNSKII